MPSKGRPDPYTHSTIPPTLTIIRRRRGPANRLGFAMQLCYLRFPGVIWASMNYRSRLGSEPTSSRSAIESWNGKYGQRTDPARLYPERYCCKWSVVINLSYFC
ncbi:DUF4158 domain-containing protein [Salmonella enterica subsp. enterica]|nr:DUF4158 domain-containing protein [Salmonella enterica subsp. enterica]